MTCIAGVVEKGKVWIGGDSAGVAGLHIVRRSDPKVFVHGPFIMGFTTSFRMGQILMFDSTFKLPKHPKKMDDYEFMVSRFTKAIRESFKEAGYLGKDKDDGSETGGTFLVGYKGTLYTIHGDFQVGISLHGYSACGCGQDIALGSLYTSNFPTALKAKKRIQRALDAACEFSAGVSGPYVILKN